MRVAKPVRMKIASIDDLPWVAVNKEYVFEGQNGKQTLAELFDGRSQLIIYHFMFDISWDHDEYGKTFRSWLDPRAYEV